MGAQSRPEFAGYRKTDKTKYELFSDEFPRVSVKKRHNPKLSKDLGYFGSIIFCTYKSEYGYRSFEGTEVSAREELAGDGDAESPEDQGKVIRTGVENTVIVTRQPVYLPTV